ncbi:hypothetical protein L6452_19301 [Arctium lappa]|uniref:Uncharacterized protein n=1 Tax=Arctium lappa TaxID=4217 RepID=A0ACB9B8B2_ARCLA|nr:hypothetical protein L6452_19301 [Arctium lappa]
MNYSYIGDLIPNSVNTVPLSIVQSLEETLDGGSPFNASSHQPRPSVDRRSVHRHSIVGQTATGAPRRLVGPPPNLSGVSHSPHSQDPLLFCTLLLPDTNPFRLGPLSID